jgi:hypothetical protein
LARVCYTGGITISQLRYIFNSPLLTEIIVPGFVRATKERLEPDDSEWLDASSWINKIVTRATTTATVTGIPTLPHLRSLQLSEWNGDHYGVAPMSVIHAFTLGAPPLIKCHIGSHQLRVAYVWQLLTTCGTTLQSVSLRTSPTIGYPIQDKHVLSDIAAAADAHGNIRHDIYSDIMKDIKVITLPALQSLDISIMGAALILEHLRAPLLAAV